jgi:hypothetical protein
MEEIYLQDYVDRFPPYTCEEPWFHSEEAKDAASTLRNYFENFHHSMAFHYLICPKLLERISLSDWVIAPGGIVCGRACRLLHLQPGETFIVKIEYGEPKDSPPEYRIQNVASTTKRYLFITECICCFTYKVSYRVVGVGADPPASYMTCIVVERDMMDKFMASTVVVFYHDDVQGFLFARGGSLVVNKVLPSKFSN